MHIKYKPAHAGSTAAGMGCCTEGMGLMGEKNPKTTKPVHSCSTNERERCKPEMFTATRNKVNNQVNQRSRNSCIIFHSVGQAYQQLA